MPCRDRTQVDAVRTPSGWGRARALARALALSLSFCATTAWSAEVMYSWREPGSGQLHLSSVPPPWLRSAEAAERGPRVNVFKDGKFVPPERVGPGGRVLDPKPGKPGATAPGDAPKLPDLSELLTRRDAAMDRLVAEALRVGPASGNEAFFVVLDRYLELCALADAADPVGVAVRNAERDRGMQRVKTNIERVLQQPGPRAAFQNEATRWFSDKSDLAAQKIVRCIRDGYC